MSVYRTIGPLVKFATGHGARTYVNECKNKDKLIDWSMLVF